jgi:hypothetical protein
MEYSTENIIPKDKNICLYSIIYGNYNHKKNLHRDSNPGQIFVVVAFASVISLSKQTALVFKPLFYRA